uniref:Uncharacterized protein n=1 Tax=Anguilla anguilla TaxID=7936 RepID=A0A0E9TVL0_ANGAN
MTRVTAVNWSYLRPHQQKVLPHAIPYLVPTYIDLGDSHCQ